LFMLRDAGRTHAPVPRKPIYILPEGHRCPDMVDQLWAHKPMYMRDNSGQQVPVIEMEEQPCSPSWDQARQQDAWWWHHKTNPAGGGDPESMVLRDQVSEHL